MPIIIEESADLGTQSVSFSSSSSSSDDGSESSAGISQGHLSQFIALLDDVSKYSKDREAAEMASLLQSWSEQLRKTSAAAPVGEINPEEATIDQIAISQESVKPVTKGVWAALKSVWNCKIPLSLYYCSFKPKVSSVLIQGVSIAYGVVYALVSKSKAEPVLGEIAIIFSLFSCIANYAQINITVGNFRDDFVKNLSGLAMTLVKLFCCCGLNAETVANHALTKILLGMTGIAVAALSVCTAAPLASATLEATGVPAISYAMWMLRSLLVLKSTVGLPDMLISKFKNLHERWLQVENGDKSFARFVLELSVLGLSGYVATTYSFSQEETIGEYCVKELKGWFEKIGLDLTGQDKLFSNLGIGPLLALNFVFIVGGGETGLDLLDRFNPLLLITFLLAAPTGFPGIALISNVDVIKKVNAYLAAVLSNWRSLAQLPYVDEKVKKDHIILAIDQLRLLLGEIRNASDERCKQEMQKLSQNVEVLKEGDLYSKSCHALHDVLTAYKVELEKNSHSVEQVKSNLQKIDGSIYGAISGSVKSVYNCVTCFSTKLFSQDIRTDSDETSPLLAANV